jgi:hypothetical protein
VSARQPTLAAVGAVQVCSNGKLSPLEDRLRDEEQKKVGGQGWGRFGGGGCTDCTGAVSASTLAMICRLSPDRSHTCDARDGGTGCGFGYKHKQLAVESTKLQNVYAELRSETDILYGCI